MSFPHFCFRTSEPPRQSLFAILFLSWLKTSVELLLSVLCPMPVYLNSRDAAVQNTGLIMTLLHVPNVYDLLCGAQQNCGKHLRLRYMLKLKQHSLEETDVNKNSEC